MESRTNDRTTCFSRNPEQTIASLILTQIDFPVYILWDIFLDNVTTSLPFIMTPVAVNMDKTKRWLERQVMPSLLMIKEIEKQTGANYLEEIDRHTRLTEKQELKIKQMTTDIADMIEKDTAVPQENDGIFNFFKICNKTVTCVQIWCKERKSDFFENRSLIGGCCPYMM